MPSILTTLDDMQRKHLHALFAEWLNDVSEADYAQLDVARERVAPGQVCSVVTLVCRCLARPDLQAELPPSLVRLLQARHWPQPFAASIAV